ncbi:MAG TPA: filamentous hemagglutinin N-terminal domain-containing protein [Candidatus Omnitrophota bacterium]|nr:filamentous hemagglutinin N-terminal domain-containing protein [Candidatus Omnitrophota bacterium]
MFIKRFRHVSIFVVLSLALAPVNGYCLPQGEQVVEGSATFDRSQADTLNVNQATDKMIANYNSFSIAQPEAVHFIQPSSSSIALNRVTGVDPSMILGTLTANGRIFLINPNGVTFGQGCRVDTMGLVASTLNLSNADFMAGRYTFAGNGGSVVNLGYLNAPGGYVALLGSRVENRGIIEAELGSVALASGKAVTLKLDPKGLISVAVDEATIVNADGKDDAVLNVGTIRANGGKVLLTAQALDGVFKNAVNTSGIIEANSIDELMGEVGVSANQRVAIGGLINAAGGIVRVDSQGADFNAAINADFGVYNAHGGDTFITGGSYSGDQTWLDDFNIFVSGDTYVEDGAVYIDAGADLSVTDASIIADNGDIFLNGFDISIEDSLIEATKNFGTVCVSVNAGNDLSIAGTGGETEAMSTVRAENYGSGDAYVTLQAGADPGESPASYLTITNSEVTARVYDPEGTACVGIYNDNGPVSITGSDVLARIMSGAYTAQVDIKSTEDITIDDSTVTALVDTDGTAEVYLNPQSGGIAVMNESAVTALVGGEGEAGVYMYDYELEDIFTVPLLDIDLGAAILGDILISGNSYVGAQAWSSSSEGGAYVYMNTQGNIDVLDESGITVMEACGTAAMSLLAGADITIDGTSSLYASSNDSISTILAFAGGNLNALGPVDVFNNDGAALAALLAMGDLTVKNSTAMSIASGGPDALQDLEDMINELLGGDDPTQCITIDRQHAYSGFSLLGSVMGNVYLTDIYANMVGVAALGLGGEGTGSIYGGEGEIWANYLAMLAACDIGAADAPINMDVDIVSAYSYAKGDIYLYQNNARRNVELGMYVPITLYNLEDTGDGEDWVEYEDQIGIGASVAAKDGIVHVTSEGDMTVNSVIALRGGVFLESKQGNIYAGRGWCPSISQGTIDSAAGIAGALVDFILGAEDDEETDTDEVIAGLLEDFFMDATFMSSEEDGNMYLSPVMMDFPLDTSAHVWATGQSYFSAPNGTIGADPSDDADLQGAIKGIVRPGADGDTSGPGFDRVPASGFVAYEDADGNGYGAANIYEDSANTGDAVQIWPDPSVTPFVFGKPLNPLEVCIQLIDGSKSAAPVRGADDPEPFTATAGLTLNYSVYVPPVPPPVPPPAPPQEPLPDASSQLVGPLVKNIRAYYEILNVYRFVSSEPATPTFFSYRPLTPTNMAAFDDLDLDIGAYDFISDNIKTKKPLSPYYGL